MATDLARRPVQEVFDRGSHEYLRVAFSSYIRTSELLQTYIVCSRARPRRFTAVIARSCKPGRCMCTSATTTLGLLDGQLPVKGVSSSWTPNRLVRVPGTRHTAVSEHRRRAGQAAGAVTSGMDGSSRASHRSHPTHSISGVGILDCRICCTSCMRTRISSEVSVSHVLGAQVGSRRQRSCSSGPTSCPVHQCRVAVNCAALYGARKRVLIWLP